MEGRQNQHERKTKVDETDSEHAVRNRVQKMGDSIPVVHQRRESRKVYHKRCKSEITSTSLRDGGWWSLGTGGLFRLVASHLSRMETGGGQADAQRENLAVLWPAGCLTTLFDGGVNN